MKFIFNSYIDLLLFFKHTIYLPVLGLSCSTWDPLIFVEAREILY